MRRNACMHGLLFIYKGSDWDNFLPRSGNRTGMEPILFLGKINYQRMCALREMWKLALSLSVCRVRAFFPSINYQKHTPADADNARDTCVYASDVRFRIGSCSFRRPNFSHFACGHGTCFTLLLHAHWMNEWTSPSGAFHCLKSQKGVRVHVN